MLTLEATSCLKTVLRQLVLGFGLKVGIAGLVGRRLEMQDQQMEDQKM